MFDDMKGTKLDIKSICYYFSYSFVVVVVGGGGGGGERKGKERKEEWLGKSCLYN